ncbi:MAG: universal stress protein [Gammaproteobacteria bacterium]
MKDLIVHVDNLARCAVRVDYAARLAQRFNARLTGVYALQVPIMPLDDGVLQGMEGGAVSTAESMEYNTQIAHADAQAAKAAFHQRAAHHGVTASWCTMAGAVADVVVAYARYADLVIVGQTPQWGEDIAADTALRAGRPVVVVPQADPCPLDATRVLVAWDASREAARALHDALPLLRTAGQITMLSIGAAEQMPPGVDIVEHLAAYGIDVAYEQEDGGERDPGRSVLARAAELGCDLIVMGAYGHSPLRQRVLGGTSSYVLKHMAVPVLMSH